MGKTERLTTPGINIRWPWSDLIITGKKTVETRGYPLPKKYLNQNVAIIETYGGRQGSLKGKARIVGVVRFSSCFKYKTREEWAKDFDRHKVETTDSSYSFNATLEKWGWEIDLVCRVAPPVAPPVRRGIKYAVECRIPKRNLCCNSSDIARLIKS